jgi:DNA-binding MurR/RpiR family transcriptional regulator
MEIQPSNHAIPPGSEFEGPSRHVDFTAETRVNSRGERTPGASIAPARIIERIKARSATMTHGQAQIADYIINHPSTFCFLSVQELAAEAKVSHATVIRFCKSLGYAGFSDFSRDAQDVMKFEITVANRFGLEQAPDKGTDNSPVSLFGRALRMETDSIAGVARNISMENVKECLDMMERAENIYILARMSSFPIALHFENTLSKVSFKSTLVPEQTLQAAALLKRMNEKSLLFSIAYARYSKDTLTFTDLAKRKGVRIVSVTNSLASPLVALSDVSFIIPSPPFSFIDIFAGAFSFTSALSIAFSAYSKQDKKDSLSEFTRIMAEGGHVIE